MVGVISVAVQGKKNKKKLLNKKTFQINLEKNDNQSGSILFRFS